MSLGLVLLLLTLTACGPAPPLAPPTPPPTTTAPAPTPPRPAPAEALTLLPPGALLYAPLLVTTQQRAWPEAPQPWTLGGIVEQESPRWDPRAELKTSREYGFGLGQTTVAYNADGSERFNTFKNLKAEYASLRGWDWEHRYDPAMQLLALVEMTRTIHVRIFDAAGDEDHWSFNCAAYNGGQAGLAQDRLLCRNTKGCDSRRWFGHVELTSLKSRTPQAAYGNRSFFQISREYVKLVIRVRREKYAVFWPARVEG